jgi:hypothetical protein
MNIQNLLKKLNLTMTDAAIGAAIGVPQPTITRLRNGVHKETSYSRGEAIKNLARERKII